MKTLIRLGIGCAMIVFGMAFVAVGSAGAHVGQTSMRDAAVFSVPAGVPPATAPLLLASDRARPNFNRPNFNRPDFDRPFFNRPNFNRPDFDRPFFNRPNFNRPDFDRPFFVRPFRPFFNPFLFDEDFDD